MTDSNDIASNEAKPTKTKDYGWNETLRTFIFAVLLAVLFRSLFFEPFHIPSSSMKNTLLIGDYLFVSKSSYGYSRYSFPYGMPLFDGRVWEDKPERGDVAVFRLPTNTRIDFIKRVIGLPGDRIQMKAGQLYINGLPTKRERLDDFGYRTDAGDIVKIRQYKETLPNGVSYTTLDMTPLGEVDNTDVYTVPEGHYFMMGDNRDNSTDSRYTDKVGYVPLENFIGRAELVMFSMQEDMRFWEAWKWFTGFRDERFFQAIK